MSVVLISGVQMIVVTIETLVANFFFFKQKTAYEMRISDWSSDVCSSDLPDQRGDDLRRQHPLEREVLPRFEDAAETGADRRVDEGSRDDPDEGGEDIGAERHAEEGRNEIDDEEGKGRDQPQEQQIAERVQIGRAHV